VSGEWSQAMSYHSLTHIEDRMRKVISKIVSGGQTGVDRAALDVALGLGIPCGGWCPRGRLAEDGSIPERYPLTETILPVYPQRTEWNVRDSDGTLVLTMRDRASRVALAPTGSGTALTIQLARRQKKPCLIVNLNDHPAIERVRRWCLANQIRILNVAGPRESENRGIYSKAVEFLRQLLEQSEPSFGRKTSLTKRRPEKLS
jgi:Circularly permutated YpsA SLOG family